MVIFHQGMCCKISSETFRNTYYTEKTSFQKFEFIKKLDSTFWVAWKMMQSLFYCNRKSKSSVELNSDFLAKNDTNVTLIFIKIKLLIFSYSDITNLKLLIDQYFFKEITKMRSQKQNFDEGPGSFIACETLKRSKIWKITNLNKTLLWKPFKHMKQF